MQLRNQKYVKCFIFSFVSSIFRHEAAAAAKPRERGLEFSEYISCDLFCAAAPITSKQFDTILIEFKRS